MASCPTSTLGNGIKNKPEQQGTPQTYRRPLPAVPVLNELRGRDRSFSEENIGEETTRPRSKSMACIPIGKPQIGFQRSLSLSPRRVPPPVPPRNYPTKASTHSAVVIQRCYRIHRMKRKLLEISNNVQRRRNIVQELLSTEIDYVSHLLEISEGFGTAMTKVGILDKDTTERVFLGVQRLAQLHSILLRDIAPRLRGWTANSSIGDCLTVFFSNPQLAELYSAYAHNFRESREELLSLYHSNKAFASFVDTKQSPAGMGSGIHYLLSLCISIIQRVPRYELLFKDLQRGVPDYIPDAQNLLTLATAIRKLSNRINDNACLINRASLSQTI